MIIKFIINLFFGFFIFNVVDQILNTYTFYLILISSYIYIKNINIKSQKININDNNYKNKFSILVAAKNEEKNILKTIKYLENIDYSNFEAIIINDNSTDKTLEILNNLKLPENFKIVNRKRKEGFVAGVLNDGLKSISNDTDIIGIIDADTIPVKNMLNIINNYYDGNFKGCIQPQEWHYNYSESILTKIQHLLCIYENYNNILDNRFKIGHFIHKDVFKKYSYDENSILEDAILSEEIKKDNIYKIIQTDDVIVLRTFHNKLKSIYSQQYRYQLGDTIFGYNNKIIQTNLIVPLLLFYNFILFTNNFFRINLLILFLVFNLIDNALENYYDKTVISALNNYNIDDHIKNGMKKYKNNYLDTFITSIFGILILLLRLLPFFKIPIGIEKYVWNRFKM